MRNVKFWHLLAVSILLASIGNCSIRKLAIGEMTDMIKDGRVAFESETDMYLAESALASNLKLLEAVQKSDPENEELNMFLAEGYNSYTLAFVEDRFEELQYEDSETAEMHRQRAIRLYLRARSYAALVLAEKLEADPLTISEADFKQKLQKIEKEDVGTLFWFALSWGASVNLRRDDMEALSELGKVEMAMQRVKELDPDYFFGGVHLFEGVYYGARSPMMGGDHSRSKLAFLQAAKSSGDKLLMVPVMHATTLCLQTQDRACFSAKLNEVLARDAAAIPEVALANTLAQKKAKRWLAKIDDLFLPEESSIEPEGENGDSQ